MAIAALALLAYFAISEGGAGKPAMGGSSDYRHQHSGADRAALRGDGLFPAASGGGLFRGSERRSIDTVRDFTYSAVWMIYGSGLMLIGFWKRSAFLRWQAIALLALTVVKVFVYRHRRAGARLSHRRVYRSRRNSTGGIVLLSAQPAKDACLINIVAPSTAARPRELKIRLQIAPPALQWQRLDRSRAKLTQKL